MVLWAMVSITMQPGWSDGQARTPPTVLLPSAGTSMVVQVPPPLTGPR